MENWDTGLEEMERHLAQQGDVADDHRVEHYCKRSGLSYYGGGHSLGPAVEVAVGERIV